MTEPGTFTEREIAHIFGAPGSALAGARREGLLKRLRYALWRAYIAKMRREPICGHCGHIIIDAGGYYFGGSMFCHFSCHDMHKDLSTI